ncbi:copper-translocating P-type ATPase [Ammoniphilus oxalaticus]|uniref:Copper-translocating P-type ATPase n=1 Tax=Ammoniphilus oxalaticus TaxID=66863 RepID=A0A419SK75_9BACL|nr:heavy metal translocating P-type ATPase [Ammoniphilus oxalaticus]RKD24339.1 copper-translocating P-type ATPase [Ammoniphilus oxalaticus]
MSANVKEKVQERDRRQEEGIDVAAWFKQHGESVAVIGSGALTLMAWLLSGQSQLSVGLFLLAYIIGGYAKMKEGIITLVKERDLDVNLLMLLAAIGAASIGYWLEGAVLIFIFAVSGVLENYTLAKSYREIASLMDMKPEMAVRLIDGQEHAVKIEELQVKDLVIVKPGERIPADGIVKDGVSFVDQAMITGESVPVEKATGEEVFAGTLNGQGSLIIEVTSSSESTLFSKIIRMVQEAQSEKPASQQFMERFESTYAKSVLGITVVLIMIPPFVFGWSWTEALYRAMVFLVVASPCALVASVMPVILSAISSSARKGVLFKGGAHLEILAEIKAIAVDKTGTLTLGRPQVTDIHAYQGYERNDILRIAGAIEMMSEHPISLALIEKAKEEGIELIRPNQMQSFPGRGVAAEYEGLNWKVGNADFVGSELFDEQTRERINELEKQGKTVIYLTNHEGLAGLFAIKDTIRLEAKETIAQLKNLGIAVVMLTGDREGTARAIADEAGIDEVYAEMLPADKVEKVKEMRQKYGQVAMLGDGVNDAPALATASVGIAMGITGSDVSLETADLVLVHDDLVRLPGAIRTSQKARRVIKQNIVFSLTVIFLLILSNFFQFLTLPLGVIGHEGSTILVILNGLRLLKS